MTESPHSSSRWRAKRWDNWLGMLGRNSGLLRQTLFLAVFAVFVLALAAGSVYATWSTDVISIREGQIADRDIKAPSTATFVSEIRTEERRREAYDDSRNIVLRPDPSVAPNQTASLRESLQIIEDVRDNDSLPRSVALEQIRSSIDGLSATDAQSILDLSDDGWNRLRFEAQRLLENALAGEIRQEDIASVREGLPQQVNVQLPMTERALAVGMVNPFIRANVEIDEQRTREAREAAAANVEPVLVTVQAGQVIIRDGDPVTRYDIEKLNHFGLLSPGETWQRLAGYLGLLGLATLALALYLGRFAPEICRSRQLMLVGLVVAVPVVAGRLLLQNEDLVYMFPAAAAIMLLAILIDFHVAVVVGGFLGLYLGIVSGASFEIAFLTILSSVAGAAVIWRAERTMTFLLAGLAVMATTFVGAILFTLVAGELSAQAAGSIFISAAVNGALSASLTFLFFSLLGTLFGITTHLQLLELAHPNQPLLYRLAREAPGTYHHSIVVSNLAESAAERVGADPLFTRVAVLYHDVGKVLRPTFFIENQANRANVHDSLDPKTSARIILDHVSDGVRLARKARLPQPIIDVIAQHHGTTLIKYFYHQALNGGEAVDEADFRYPGPRPQTKAAGIIMLADSVEATVRALSQTGKLYEETSQAEGYTGIRQNHLEEIVEKIFRERVDDGQLDDCDLTIKQIEQIRQVFVSILEGIYHPRVEYPEISRDKESARTPEIAAVETP
jgi:cyclic-di-AMP phosphodiesterase PgpH